MNMLVSAAALLLACAAFFAYDQITFRQSLVRTLSAQAQIIGSNSVSALIFNDPQSATNTLSALKNSPNIASAGVITVEQRPFAQYSRDAGDTVVNIPPPPEGRVEAYWFKTTHLVLVHSIVFQGKTLGFVYLRADLRELDQRLKRYATIAFVVLLLSLLAALIVSALFRRSVAEPIIQLAEVARAVSQDNNYSVRAAPAAAQDEIALLIDAFNNMLQQIQHRDNALQEAHDELEERVEERTRELVSSNRELEAFSYSVSHDLRGPLEVMNGFSYVLLKNYAAKLDSNGKECLQSIRSAARRMSELIDDLLNLSRVTTSDMHREEIDLSLYARTIMEELCRSASGRHVEFVVPSQVQAYADSRLVQIVMQNLLENAWKYTSHHERARIEFGFEEKDGSMIYFVKDDGSGFDPRSTDRLFQPFNRLHTASEFPGNGIGLATVRRIVQRHGGEVWAEGAVENGATFHFTLEPNRSGGARPNYDA
ncbi:MAG TPA: ATP-binding protein [Terriglobales bacterium]|jgi:signal transduction histidine kinase|nr:ATP-binding protein [Terriglobales bacterium]